MYKFIKRRINILVSIIAIFCLLPLFIPIILLLRITGEKEMFYFQKRIGFKNVPFAIYKFATMLKDSAQMGNGTITVVNDYRVTKVGRFLRVSKVNELPQLFNILKGDMSFVGLRPLPLSDFKDYPVHIQDSIYNIVLGLTGIGSLVFRDEERYFIQSNLSPKEINRQMIAPYKGALELWYYHHQSFPVDLKILILTAWSILFKNTDMVYKSFPDLPIKPDTLTVEGIKKLHL